jgi:DNA polymerase-3 subunit epsilon
VDSFEALGKSAGIWRINAEGDVTSTHQYKVNSGASAVIQRATATVRLTGPKVLVTNIAVPTIVSGRHSLHFLPDRLLVADGRTFASVSYAALDTQVSATRFIESGRVPRDGEQVDTTWQYVNVKGGPDRRFKNNRQLPVMLYGRLTLTSPDGLRWIVDASQRQRTEQVGETLKRAVTPASVALSS